jgi:oligosaccharide repeat unit polymerase
MIIVFKLLAIFFSFLIFIQAYIIKTGTGSYLLPASLFSLIWFFFSFVPLLVLFGVPINPLPIFYIFLATFSFSLSALPFNWRFAFEGNKENKQLTLLKFNSGFLRYSFYVSIFLSFVFSSYLVLSNGFDLASFGSNFIETSARYAALRGNESLEYGLTGTLSIFFTYFSALLGGIVSYFKTSSRKKFFCFLLAVLPSLFVMLSQSSKLIFMVAIIFYMASTVLMKIVSSSHSLFNFSGGIKIAAIGLLILPLILIAFTSREGYNNFDTTGEALDILLPAINSYLFGSLYAFSDFFSYYFGMASTSVYTIEYYNFGYYSFKSIFDSFGGTKVFPPGFYSDNYDFKGILSTNIFTFFRGLIQDFGLVGSLLFMYFFGFIFHFSFYRLLLNKELWLGCSLFIMFGCFAGLSFLSSIFTARYIFLITFLFFVLLSVNSLLYQKKTD